MIRLTVYHIRVDALGTDMAWAIAGIADDPRRATVASELMARGYYERVATFDSVGAPSVLVCSMAYGYTQNVDRSWSLDPRGAVKPVPPESLRRSSMIGDVFEFGIVHGADYAPIKRYVCAPYGFLECPMTAPITPVDNCF